MFNIDTLDKFTRAYIECALWSSNDESDPSGGEPMDANYDIHDIAEETMKKMIAECKKFQEKNTDLFEDYPLANAGHDFWLTRNHHGAGYWDNDFGTEENCEKLAKAAEKCGDVNLYVGDDGRIYQS